MSMQFQRTADLTVMFADVAGSVGLYTSYGDIRAHRIVTDCLQTMSSLISKNHGRVVETIGDEVMSVFPNPDTAMNAACSIQDAVQIDSELGFPLGVRIGFHQGPTVVDNGHPFGDTVNVAARMVAIAKAGQILISQQTFLRLSRENRARTRHFNRILLKGKISPTDIHEVVWDDMDSTKSYVKRHSHSFNRQQVAGVRITYGAKTLDVSEFQPEISLGRSEHCEIVVESELASRLHSSLQYQQGRVVLTDKSTNGTFVRTQNGKRQNDSLSLHLHHEDWLMQSKGVISLGEPITADNERLIFFECF
ncbi:MAG: adenylate/guanylate cyclase domain-containing protein [Gammaproteobacteria bacterium]|nr:adenylate/guanylate cyclase domain-containing protein [Gammaproteobacteria bacterium]MDH5801401.1 adenylate/guanylate cyclase domain-containing protein [Gammaproteobacteria bacterium]